MRNIYDLIINDKYCGDIYFDKYEIIDKSIYLLSNNGEIIYAIHDCNSIDITGNNFYIYRS